MKIKPWTPASTDTDEERVMMIQAALKELHTSKPGDHTVYVGQDTLVYGTIDITGEVHIYETKILASNVDAHEQQLEGNAYVASGGVPS